MSTNRAFPRRAMQMLWLAAGLLFTFAVIHSTTSEDSTAREYISKGYNAVKGATGASASPAAAAGGNGDFDRPSIKEHMMIAERSWAADVKKRHDMIKADYGDVSKMPL